MRARWWLALGLLVPTVASAQVNAEYFAAQVSDPGYGLQLGVGQTSALGNVNLFDLREDASLHWLSAFEDAPTDRLWIKDRALLTVRGAHKAAEGAAILNETLVHLRLTHHFLPRVGVEAFGQVNNDRAVLLDWRFVVGSGVRLVAVNADRVSLWGGTGYMLEREIRNVPVGGPDAVEVTNHRSTSYLSWRLELIEDALTWTNTAYLQPNLLDPGDIQVVDESNLDIKITDVFGVRSSFRMRQDTRPPADLVPVDLRVSSALTFSWSGPKAPEPAADGPGPDEPPEE